LRIVPALSASPCAVRLLSLANGLTVIAFGFPPPGSRLNAALVALMLRAM